MDVNELEYRLLQLSGEAPAGLRDRVLQAADEALVVKEECRQRRGWPMGAIAAAAVMAVSLSVVDSSRDEFAGRSAGKGAAVAADIQADWQLQAAEPGVLK